jgi:branched-chain amino acid transport system ATP-binding protein
MKDEVTQTPLLHPSSFILLPSDVSLLTLENVVAGYGQIVAVKGISLDVHEGEVVTLIGANGAGKTTTLRTISGLIRPREGTITFDGRRIDQMPAHEVVQLGLSQAPEGRGIFGRLTVRENLEMGAFNRGDRANFAGDLERVYSLFPRLKERLSQAGGTLSGGEQQMLAIGRALMARPKLLLLDEPSMGLAPVLVETIFQTIQDINRQGTTILLVEQNAHMALEVASRGYVLESGRVVAAAPAAELAASELVRKTYLGEE